MPVINEILQTEKNYRESLNLINSKFLAPLNFACQHGDPIISEAEISTIFSNIDGILEVFIANSNHSLLISTLKVSNQLATGLSVRIEEEKSCRIHDVFLNVVRDFLASVLRIFSPMEKSFQMWGLKFYKKYVSNFERGQTTLRIAMEKNKKFHKFVTVRFIFWGSLFFPHFFLLFRIHLQIRC